MTLIVAWRDALGVVTVGADRGAFDVDTAEYSTLVQPKIFSILPNVFAGCSGSLRVMQLLRYTQYPEFGASRTAMEWIVRSFIPKLREAIREDGDEASLDGSNILLVIGHRMFVIEEEWGVVESNLPYAAIGSGRVAALGACSVMHALVQDKPSITALTVMKTVFDATREHVFTVGPLVDVEDT